MLLENLKNRDPAERWAATGEAAPPPPARIALQPQPPAGFGPQGGGKLTPGGGLPPAGSPPAGSPGSTGPAPGIGASPGLGSTLPAPGSSLGTLPPPGGSLGTPPIGGSPGSGAMPDRPFDRPLEGLPSSPLGPPPGDLRTRPGLGLSPSGELPPGAAPTVPGAPFGSDVPGGNFGNDDLYPSPEPNLSDEGDGSGLSAGRPIVSSPKQLRPITDIRPHWDYSADPDSDDPCLYLCPRPDGLPCKTYGDGRRTPACPDEVTLGEEPFVPRLMPPSVYAWKASNISYNPLYFQDVQLERYGHTYGIFQPAVSLGLFGVQLIGLPYQLALDPPCKCEYPLGYYRPGEPAPKLFYQIPLNLRAAVVTAGFYSGLGVILP